MARSNSTDHAGFVYFIKAGMNAVKVGRSIDPEKRLQTLQKHTHISLTLEHVIYSNDPSWLEAKLHRHFHTQSLFGEWFRVTPEQLDAIRTCRRHDRLDLLSQGKTLSEAAASLGRKGGSTRAAKLTPQRRSEIARMGGKARHMKRPRGGKA